MEIIEKNSCVRILGVGCRVAFSLYSIKSLAGFFTKSLASPELLYNHKRTTMMIFKARMNRLLEELHPAPSSVSSSQFVRSNSPLQFHLPLFFILYFGLPLLSKNNSSLISHFQYLSSFVLLYIIPVHPLQNSSNTSSTVNSST